MLCFTFTKASLGTKSMVMRPTGLVVVDKEMCLSALNWPLVFAVKEHSASLVKIVRSCSRVSKHF